MNVIVPFDDSRLDRCAFSAAGFSLIDTPGGPDLKMQCSRHDFDLIISTAHHFHAPDYPEDVPVLCLSHAPPERNGFGGVISWFPPPLPPEELLRQADNLTAIRALHRKIAAQEQEVLRHKEKLLLQQQSMQQHAEFLDVLASRDGLTGLFNRRHLNKILQGQFEHSNDCGSELSLLLIDIDFFNELNRAAGRSFGDFVLNDLAARLTSCTQPNGICFRFSGEIFLALLPATDRAAAEELAAAIQRNLTAKSFTRGNESRSITVSIGIVSLAEHQPANSDEFITMAEWALFSAKSEGRNRAVVYRQSNAAPPNPARHNLVFLKDSLARIMEKTRTSTINCLQLLARDMAGEKNQDHINNVQTYVDLLCRHLNLPIPIIQTFKNAIILQTAIRFLLHNEMINRQAQFSASERETMADFPYKLAEVTELFDYFSNERAILLYHGERYDGTGYPEGAHGSEIPLGARIFSLVDALAAMNADRPHRPRLQPEKIIAELSSGAGRQFDPCLVIKTLEIIKAYHLLEVDDDLIDSSIELINQRFPDHML